MASNGLKLGKFNKCVKEAETDLDKLLYIR